MRDLNVAIVGCGFVANDHLKAWQKVRQARVAAVCDLSETLARNTAKLWKVPRYYTSLSELIEHSNIDVVDICTPPHTHANLAIQAMKAGFHVLLEKPMTMTAKDAEKIVKCQKTTGMKAGVIHNWLFEPPVVEATSLVEKGCLGEVFHAEVETLYPIDDLMIANRNHWCHKFPGGRFSEMLAHPIYLIRHFLGELKVGVVHASKFGEYDWMKSDELFVTFDVGKKLGNAYVSCNAPRYAIFVSLYGREAILGLNIIDGTVNILPRRKTSRFSKGFDSLRQAIQLINSTAKNAAKIAFGRWLSGHDMYINLFAQSLFDNSEPPVTVEDGYTVVKVLQEVCKRIERQEQT
jgi:predicted dehydrogenase